MRLVITSLVLATLFCGAPVVFAGPACENRAGESVRCEDPRAMPLGWTLPLEERLKHPDPGPREPTAAELGGVFALIVLFLALIALMPDFEGWTAGDPDKEDGGGEGQE